MLNFCTLYNSYYAARGLLMYKSLLHTCDDFHLYIFAFDDELLRYLTEIRYENVTVISLQEFETEEMLQVKSARTIQEYCWTCESLTIRYCLNNFNIDSCTYIDADLYFYANPKLLIDEMGDNDVLLTEHRYTAGECITYGGRFCVQFVTFRNTENGHKILDWWCDKCIEWCGADHINGLFGDQMYLEDWPERFEKVHVLRHIGGGVAPWNMQQYRFYRDHGTLKGEVLENGEIFDVVFFHFHAINISYKYPIIEYFFEGYSIPNSAQEYLQKEYVRNLRKIAKELPIVNSLNMKPMNISWITFFHRIWKRWNVKDNHYLYTYYG